MSDRKLPVRTTASANLRRLWPAASEWFDSATWTRPAAASASATARAGAIASATPASEVPVTLDRTASSPAIPGRALVPNPPMPATPAYRAHHT